MEKTVLWESSEMVIKEGIFVRNKTKSRDTALHYFVRADGWFYFDNRTVLNITATAYKGNKDLSLAAPIMLGRFQYDE